MKTQWKKILGEKTTNNFHGSGTITTESGKQYFLKKGRKSRTYSCESNGLNEIAKTGIFRTPEIISIGEDYLLTRYIESGSPSGGFFAKFGRKLARMHRYHSEVFGFYEDNFIGAGIQFNIPDDDEKYNWTAFYFNKRLLYQYKLAEKNGYVSSSLKKDFQKLESRIETIIGDTDEPPCLLHGDLWSGNYICDTSGEPVLIDPAVYYGHREADLAMTKVFGGFSPSFYEAYQQEYPLLPGWEYRENIYKLYHILNHLNIFGRSYLSEAEYIVRSYTAG